jgi:hypothetical protein
LAWLEATAPVDKVRDGAQALEHAQKACDLSDGTYWEYFDVLAAAEAEKGDFPKAIEDESHAMYLLGNDDKIDSAQMDARKALYRDKKPFHLAPPTNLDR